MTPLEFIITKLGLKYTGEREYLAKCPAHDDRNASLSIGPGRKRPVIFRCHAGCSFQEIVRNMGLSKGWDKEATNPIKPFIPPPNNAHKRTSGTDCTLEAYAEAKKLPVEFLRTLGLKDFKYKGMPAVRIPYYNTQGQEQITRYRIALQKDTDGTDNRFRWDKGAKLCLYGLNRLEAARRTGYLILVEGESDCHSLWLNDFPAVGIPGASNWKDERDAPALDGIPHFYISFEPGKGGEFLRQSLSKSSIRNHLYVLDIGRFKDISEINLDNPSLFKKRLEEAIAKAVPFSEVIQKEHAQKEQDAWKVCKELAEQPNILSCLVANLEKDGLVGEERAAKLIYLAATSRLLNRIVSVIVKGVSSSGKSFAVEQTLMRMPESAFYALTAMSEHALAYMEEPLQHRMLVIYELAGLSGETASLLTRSLLSEGCIRYATVEKTKDGMKQRTIYRPGPTGLILTTTAINIHPENETRLLSIPINDTNDQTKRIMHAQAIACSSPKPDLTTWHALQEWLELQDNRVSIPYAEALAEEIPPVATRLRRDFPTLLSLISAHALLHQATRERDENGRIIATLDDYRLVRGLVRDIMSEGVGQSVSPIIRETVAKVATILERENCEVVTYRQLANELKLDESTIRHRVRKAIVLGYLINCEEKQRQPAKIVMGESLPEEEELLPNAERLVRLCSDFGRDKEHESSQVAKEADTRQSSNLITIPASKHPLPPNSTEVTQL